MHPGVRGSFVAFGIFGFVLSSAFMACVEHQDKTAVSFRFDRGQHSGLGQIMDGESSVKTRCLLSHNFSRETASSRGGTGTRQRKFARSPQALEKNRE